jgi:hypothetical protein
VVPNTFLAHGQLHTCILNHRSGCDRESATRQHIGIISVAYQPTVFLVKKAVFSESPVNKGFHAHGPDDAKDLATVLEKLSEASHEHDPS